MTMRYEARPGAKIPPERPGHPAPPDIAARRDQIAQAVAAGLWQTLSPATATHMGGTPGLSFGSGDAAPRAVLLLLHGGGFRQGAPEVGAAFVDALIARCRVEAFSVRYRLAPEHPFPAGLVDAWRALEALRERHPGIPLIVCGDSAGGGLAAGLGVLSSAQEHPPIDALILLSPWLDLTVSAPTYETNAANDPLFSRATAETAAALYLQGQDPAHPLASPLHAEVAGFPETLTVVGSGEVLLDDSVRMDARLRASGAASRLEVIEGMDHVAVTRGMALPGAAECFEHVAAFIEQAIAHRGETGG